MITKENEENEEERRQERRQETNQTTTETNKLKEYRAKYYQINKIKLCEKAKEWKINNAERSKKYFSNYYETKIKPWRNLNNINKQTPTN